MKIKSVTILLVCWLLFSLTVPAIGQPQCPDCPPCYESTGPPACKCVWQCGSGNCCGGECCGNECCNGTCCSAGQSCCGGQCCSSECCYNGSCGCPGCCDCVGGSCVGGNCTEPCHDCNNCECEYQCNPANCETCVDDSCKDCAARYGPCCKCEDGSCVECKCWDKGAAISGSITVENAKLCQQKTHTSSISDKDHWVKHCPTSSEGTPSDSLTYSWSKNAGTNPQTGTFIGDTNQPSVVWQAPPCTGTVNIKLTTNDKPDPMDKPCPDSGSTRDDSPIDKTGTSTVSLPTGCEYAGAHDSSVHWTNPNDNYNTYPLGDWGYFDYWSATYEVDFKYENCKWVCEISDVEAKTRIQVRASNYPGFISITQASDVTCGPNNVNALLAKSDLNDSDLTDDVGAPLTKYWIHSAIIAHEEKHRSDWKDCYDSRLYTAITVAETITVDIDCAVAYTTTCQGAKSYWWDQIVWLFDWAWGDALEEYDDPSTPIDEAEVRAYEVENAIEQPVSDALPGGCTP